MNVIGEVYSQSKAGTCHVLTVLCMLTGYTFCIPLKSKTATYIVQAYDDNTYAYFGGSIHILSDSSTEFKNSLFDYVANQLVVGYKVYTHTKNPQSSDIIEGLHLFLKECIPKPCM